MPTYKIDLENAAERHYVASEHLYPEASHKGVAGYLYGIAAECAIKALMSHSGLRPLEDKDRRVDPFYAHFPALKTLLRNRIQGRHSQTLLRFIDNSFMQEWDVAMRYAKASSVSHTRVDAWRMQARSAIEAMRSK